MGKPTYIANWADGTVTMRASARVYNYAWRITVAGIMKTEGFASNKALAEKAAYICMRWFTDAQAEIVTTNVADEGYEEQLKTLKPWRIEVVYTNQKVPRSNQIFVKANGNRHLRFETEGKAWEHIKTLKPYKDIEYHPIEG